MKLFPSTGVTEQILSDYQRLEPDQADTWNPVASDFELFYRLSLLHATTHALRLSRVPVSELKLLDLGCGNGRSTRMYLDLGLRPEQLRGLDLRPGAIELAQRLNPSIQFDVYNGRDFPFADQTFNWIHLSTVISSIREQSHRQELTDQISRKLQPGGYVFYFDLVRANDFAGHDIVYPEKLFVSFNVLFRHDYHSWRFMQEFNAQNINAIYLNYCRLKTSIFPLKPSHEALLFQKLE